MITYDLIVETKTFNNLSCVDFHRLGKLVQDVTKDMSSRSSLTSLLSCAPAHFSSRPRLCTGVSLTDSSTQELKPCAVGESVPLSPLQEQENVSGKNTEKARLLKGPRWKTYHPPESKPCGTMEHSSDVCLCGCSLRTKAVLHPRPVPVLRPISRVLPSLSSVRKPSCSPVMIIRAQLPHCSPKSKAEAKSPLPSWRNNMSLRKFVPMGVWPKGFINPLSKSLAEESLHTFIYIEGSHIPSPAAISPEVSLVEGDKSFLPSLVK